MACPNCEMARIRLMIEKKQRRRALEEQGRIKEMIEKKKEARRLAEEQVDKQEEVVPSSVVETVPESTKSVEPPKREYEPPVIEFVEEQKEVVEEIIPTPVEEKWATIQKPKQTTSKNNVPRKKKKSNSKK